QSVCNRLIVLARKPAPISDNITIDQWKKRLRDRVSIRKEMTLERYSIARGTFFVSIVNHKRNRGLFREALAAFSFDLRPSFGLESFRLVLNDNGFCSSCAYGSPWCS
ncbi:MAG: hypothetical protein QXW98_08355, partial [Candidatus Caldarchaeum sp.]